MKNKKEGEIQEDQIRILKPFGPSIAKVKMPQILIEKLNNYIDKIIENEKKANELDMGAKLVGNVAQEFKLEENFSKEVGWLDFLKTGATSWISFATGKKVANFKLLNSWVVRQFKNEGLSLGTSCGINIAGAIKLGKELGPGKTIITILCDKSDRYNSKLFNKSFLQGKDLPYPNWF